MTGQDWTEHEEALRGLASLLLMGRRRMCGCSVCEKLVLLQEAIDDSSVHTKWLPFTNPADTKREYERLNREWWRDTSRHQG